MMKEDREKNNFNPLPWIKNRIRWYVETSVYVVTLFLVVKIGIYLKWNVLVMTEAQMIEALADHTMSEGAISDWKAYCSEK